MLRIAADDEELAEWAKKLSTLVGAPAEYRVSPCSPQRKENEPVDVMVSFETSRSGSVT
jgi:hypothetical protein